MMPSSAIRLIALLIGCGACLGAPSSLGAEKKCKIAKVVDLPITMNSLRPTIDVKINNRDAKFILDSGAFYSMISSATAAEYNLKTTHAPLGLRVIGIGGAPDGPVAQGKEFSLVGLILNNPQVLLVRTHALTPPPP